ncbi:MAG: HNH endonuclease signature motif containing protein [Terracidiphilus sp.]|nr:HNH endonuclease signature motif containing protein [Terracidiphilus sp.]
MRLSASGGIASLEPAVRAAFNVPGDKACKMYYLTDPQRPRQSRQRVHDEQSWRDFWSRFELCRGLLGLHLHVMPRAAPGFPDKEPSWLKIDTGVKRANHRAGGTPSSAAFAATTTPSGSPGDVQTPRSPLLRDSTLHRDFDEEKDLSYCVFCGICYDAGAQLEAAHLIPNAVSERFELEVSEDLLGRIGGYYETTLNAVAACRLCHPLFDDGLLWLEAAGAASSVAAASPTAAATPVQLLPPSSLVLRVDSSQKSDHSKSLAGRSLRLPGPTRAHLPFPPAAAWEWRSRWAPLKRQDEMAKQMGQLGVSGPCEAKEQCCSKKKQRNKNCARRMCEPCCRAALPDALHCKEHKPATPQSARN